MADDTRVADDARVADDGLIFWASKVGTENGTLTVYNGKDDTLLVTRGCFLGSPTEFLEESKRVHDARTHHEYKLLIKVATSRIEAARARLLEPVERLALGFPQKEHFKLKPSVTLGGCFTGLTVESSCLRWVGERCGCAGAVAAAGREVSSKMLTTGRTTHCTNCQDSGSSHRYQFAYRSGS